MGYVLSIIPFYRRELNICGFEHFQRVLEPISLHIEGWLSVLTLFLDLPTGLLPKVHLWDASCVPAAA